MEHRLKCETRNIEIATRKHHSTIQGEGQGRVFWTITPFAQELWWKIHWWDFIKLYSSCTAKKKSTRERRSPEGGKDYLPSSYIWQNTSALHIERTKMVKIQRKQTNKKMQTWAIKKMSLGPECTVLKKGRGVKIYLKK